jgi:LuxR family maltose regulon positive regulatory protein
VEAGVAADTVERGGIGAQLLTLRAIHAFKMGQITAALEAARRAAALDFAGAPWARLAVQSIYGAALYYAGCIDEAQATFRRAAQLAEKMGDRRRRIYALAYLALIAAESGHLADAENQIRRATSVSSDPAGGENFVNSIVSLAAATVLDMHGDTVAAAEAAELAVSLARKGAGILEVGKALLLNAKIAEDLGDDQTAAANGREAGQLLRRCADTDVSQGSLTGSHRGSRVEVRPRGPHEIGELTAKEHDVLRLLATRLSRREIGQRLYISLNTVKTHQRAVYRKLCVENRTAAITRARELGLL